MSLTAFVGIVFFGAVAAGFLGALTGLGGGVVIIPLLTLCLGMDIRYAVGAALVASIATSSGAAAAYIKKGITNIRIGMFLEVATTAGAVVGAFIALYLHREIIATVFAFVMLFSALRTALRKERSAAVDGEASRAATRLKLTGVYREQGKEIAYSARHIAGGFSLMTLAGVFSGLLGIGSGAFKVLAMDSVMGLPFKVSTTTSNFMVGVTAAASAVVYFQRGYILPAIAFPVMLGVLAGAFLGAKILPSAPVKPLRIVFSILLCFMALFMLYDVWKG